MKCNGYFKLKTRNRTEKKNKHAPAPTKVAEERQLHAVSWAFLKWCPENSKVMVSKQRDWGFFFRFSSLWNCFLSLVCHGVSLLTQLRQSARCPQWLPCIPLRTCADSDKKELPNRRQKHANGLMKHAWPYIHEYTSTCIGWGEG